MSEDNKQIIEIAAKLIENNINQICSCIKSFGKDAINNSKIGNGEAFLNYLESAIGKYSIIKNMIYRHYPVYLYDFYVDLNLKIEDQIIRTTNISEVLENYRFLVLTATGGAGKSTLLKHMFLNTIKNTNKIPIFIELRDINNNDNTLKTCIYNTLLNLKFSLDEKYFFKALESGCFVFFFDAFDEIEQNKKDNIMKEILTMTDRYNQNYYIVSSRPSDRFIAWNKFTEMRVQPLNKEQAIELIKKIKFDEQVKKKFISDLDSLLYEKYLSFASNPLLLTIMLLTFDQYAKIPEKIHLFYQQAFDTLYSKHDAIKGVFSRQMATNLASDDFVKVLSAFSAITYMDSKINFDNEMLLNYLTDAKNIEAIDFDVNDFKNDAIESVCILIQDGLVYTYSHRSFQEYFTAKFISNLSNEEQKEVLHRIFDEDADSINSDTVFDILFEIKKESLEENFIIPKLKNLKELTTHETKEGTYFNYLKLIFKSIEIDYAFVGEEGITETDPIVFSCLPNHSDIDELIKFVNRKYPSISLPTMPFTKTKPNPAFIKEYGSYNEIGCISIEFESVQLGTDLLQNILQESYIYLEAFEKAMSLLETLEKNNSVKKSTRDMLLKIKTHHSMN